MSRIGDGDVWLITIKGIRLQEAIISYGFIPSLHDNPARVLADGLKVWRGTKTPSPPKAIGDPGDLKGEVLTRTVVSTALGQPRRVSVYLPPEYDKSKTWPVIYMADGEAAPGFALLLEPLIRTGRVPPLVIIGANTPHDQSRPTSPQADLRAQEYLPTANPERFKQHEQFFVTELAAWAEREFNVSSDRTHTAVFGFSNGGVFAPQWQFATRNASALRLCSRWA